MVEGTFRGVDPLAYYVNNVADLDKKVVVAHKNKDNEEIDKLLSQTKHDFDVFICINKHYHAFVLCVVTGPAEPIFDDIMPNAESNPFDIPDVNFCYKIELAYEEVDLRMYKIKKKFCMFKDVKDSVSKSYHIGKYKASSPYALQFAILRAAPHRYNVLLNDCVEFAKEFCLQMLAFCDNWREIEEDVNSRIAAASATGLSIETLSRRVQSSGLVGNTFLGGLDTSQLFSGRHSLAMVVIVVIVFLVYPFVVSLGVLYIFGGKL